VYLPRVGDVEPEVASESARDITRGTETILIVEDDTAVRALAVRTLRARGYTVLEARDGAEALRLVNERPGSLDLLITDVVLPSLTGPELARQLRQQQDRLRVLFMSGFPGVAVLGNGELAEGSAFLSKVFTPEVLAQKVRELLTPVS
jgi:two-component system, cell cycle sensor histidine kinase and response regulator CckA